MNKPQTEHHHALQQLPNPPTQTQSRYRKPATYSAYKPTPRLRLLITFTLIALTILLYATSLPTALITSLISRLFSAKTPTSDLCTNRIGNGRCCAIYLDAMPCIDECRRVFMARDTMKASEGYTECENECLVEYRGVCGERE